MPPARRTRTRSETGARIQGAATRSPGDPLIDMVENAMANLAMRYRSPEARAPAGLIVETPALRAGDQAKYEAVERILAPALAGHTGVPETDIACRVAAAAAIGILELSTTA